MRIRRIQTTASSPVISFYNNRIIEQYAQMDTKTVTLGQLIAFGRHMNELKLIKSANYIRHELAVRLAHRLRDFQGLPFAVGTNPHINWVYHKYLTAFDTIRQIPKVETLQDNLKLCETLKDLLKSHINVIPSLVIGLGECAEVFQDSRLDDFMNNMLKTRIGRRVLAAQHISLSHEFMRMKRSEWDTLINRAESHRDKDVFYDPESTRIGIIDTKCHAGSLIRKCTDLAYQVSHFDGDFPEVVIEGYVDTTFLYIPDHIEYILFELLKNAIRQQIDFYTQKSLSKGKTGAIPPVVVTIARSPSLQCSDNFQNVTFRISDQGGGIPSELLSSDKLEKPIWSFAHHHKYRSLNKAAIFEKLKNSDPLILTQRIEDNCMDGGRWDFDQLGIGIQIARVYAEYWDGEMEIMSVDGYGTDVYVRIATAGMEQEKLAKDKKGAAAAKTLDPVQERLSMLRKLKVDLEEEETRNRMNLMKLQVRWRGIMRREKCTQLSNQLTSLKHTHERRLDRKEALIARMDEDLVEAEDQFQTAVQGHIINLDELINVQAERLDKFYGFFQNELTTLENEFETEKQNMMKQHSQQMQDLQNVVSRMEAEFQEAESETKHEFQSVREEMKNKSLEEKHAFRIQLEGNIEELWRQFQKALEDYNQATDERKAQFEVLKEKDTENAQIIDNQMKKLGKLQDTISQIKGKLNQTARECEDRNRKLREEKEDMQMQFQSLKRKIGSYRANERKKLAGLASISRSVIKELRERLDMAEKMLKLGEINRKLETEEERVVPIKPLDSETAKKIEEEQAEFEAIVKSDAFGITTEERKALQQFNQRYNKVLLDKYALDDHKAALLAENAKLKGLFKQYMDGISVSEDILAMDNSLFVVNGKTNVPLRHEPTDKIITCVDGPLHLRTTGIH